MSNHPKRPFGSGRTATAQQAARTTQDEARGQTGQVTDQARDSGRRLKDETQNRSGPA
ncbi:hypothetical protein ABZ690_16605 [Streptomyces sp. NPDC006967]|uniref:hypothetical protein n=1 Tax=unclassified Streptomyces TaxID=2593676 RepID=UPI0015E1A961|nr:hypothetical protein [Streptomyces sp. SM1]